MTDDTTTPDGARRHARSMAGTVVATMPTFPPRAATGLPDGVDPDDVLWDELVAPGGATTVELPRGGHVRFGDVDGDACAAVLLHRAGRPAERLNVADTLKVQWQAFPGAGTLLLSGLGRVLATVVEDTSGRHDALCGTSTEAGNRARYGDGAPDGPFPNGRDRLAVGLAKHGLDRRDVAPPLVLFKGVRVGANGGLTFDDAVRPGVHVTLRAELAVLVTVANVPHPLDPRSTYTVSPLRVTAWRGEPATAHDPARTATPEAERAHLRTEAAART